MLVNPSRIAGRNTKKSADKWGKPVLELEGRPAVVPMLVRALRMHQWSKNLLLFLPLLTSHQFLDPVLVLHGAQAFLAFSLTLQPGPGGSWNITLIASLIVLMGWPASVLGNELASRLGRPRVVAAIMGLSALIACTVGFSAGLPFPIVIALCFVFGVTVTGESGSVTAGAVAEAARGQRGATMAVHSCIGFAGAFVGPLAVGIVLDLAGGGASVLAWGLAFVTMGAGVALGPLALLLLRR